MICAGDFGIRFRGPSLTTVSSNRPLAMRAMCRQLWAGPAAAGPALLCVGRRPARPDGRIGLCRPKVQAVAWLAAPGGQDQWPCRAQDVTASPNGPSPDRGRKKGNRGKREGKEERDEEGRGANNLVSWRHVLSLAFRYLHGQQQGASA